MPPQDSNARNTAWEKLKAKLQKKHPAPTQDRSDIDSGSDETAFDDYKNIEEASDPLRWTSRMIPKGPGERSEKPSGKLDPNTKDVQDFMKRHAFESSWYRTPSGNVVVFEFPDKTDKGEVEKIRAKLAVSRIRTTISPDGTRLLMHLADIKK